MIKYLCLVPGILLSLSAHAAEWSTEPRISVRAGYNDNIRITSSPHDSVWETTLSPSIKYGIEQENRGISGLTSLFIRRFMGGSGRESSSALDREDVKLKVGAWHNTLLSNYKIDIDFTRDSTLDSELDQFGNVVDDERATREQLLLRPSWSRMLTELTRLDASLSSSNVSYSGGIGTANLVGFDYQAASLSLAHQLTPRIQGTVSTGYSNFLPDSDSDSMTLSLQAGLSYNFSEMFKATFLAGQRQTISDTDVLTGICIGANPGATFPSCIGGTGVNTGTTKTEVETESAVYTASISRSFETGALSASLSRSSAPSSEGELLDTTRLTLAGNYKVTETLHSELKIEYTENETNVNLGGFTPLGAEKETFIRITPRLIWRWSRQWRLSGELQYAENDDPASGAANRKAIYITLDYLPEKWTRSR